MFNICNLKPAVNKCSKHKNSKFSLHYTCVCKFTQDASIKTVGFVLNMSHPVAFGDKKVEQSNTKNLT